MNMNLSLIFARLFFSALSTLFMVVFTTSFVEGSFPIKLLTGVCLGASFSLAILALESFFRKFNLKSFNTIAVGLFLGYLMGKGLSLSFDAILSATSLSTSLAKPTIDVVNIILYLFGLYTATLLTIRAADEIYLSIPFVQFTQTTRKKRDIVFDVTVLSDARIIDFVASGILNNQVVLPRFILKYFDTQLEHGDESAKARAKKALDTIKKLRELDNLDLREDYTDFADIKDIHQKILKFAKNLDANILTADSSRAQLTTQEGVIYISLHILSNALRPMMPPGETISIKVQRYGKEPKQGVGYLDDGTMVVINNGGDFIGEVIDSQVISVKQTSAGRIIFTNALAEESEQPVGNSSYNYEHQGA